VAGLLGALSNAAVAWCGGVVWEKLHVNIDGGGGGEGGGLKVKGKERVKRELWLGEVVERHIVMRGEE